LTILISPFIPHIAEEVWQMLGKSGSILNARLPEFDTKKAEKDIIEFVVQVNGKVRAKFDVPKSTSQEEIETKAFEDSKIQSYLENQQIVKKIFVKDKLLNIVIK